MDTLTIILSFSKTAIIILTPESCWIGQISLKDWHIVLKIVFNIISLSYYSYYYHQHYHCHCHHHYHHYHHHQYLKVVGLNRIIQEQVLALELALKRLMINDGGYNHHYIILIIILNKISLVINTLPLLVLQMWFTPTFSMVLITFYYFLFMCSSVISSTAVLFKLTMYP